MASARVHDLLQRSAESRGRSDRLDVRRRVLTGVRSIAVIVQLTLVLAVVPVAAAQGPTDNPPDPNIADGSLQRQLDNARRSWRASGPRSYRFELRQRCFCPPQTSVLVVVRDGHPTKYPARLKSLATVPRLFTLIQGAIDHRFASIDVSYGRRGVPRSISLNRFANAVDDELAYTIKRFTPLKQRAR
jgi:hypothetical protein